LASKKSDYETPSAVAYYDEFPKKPDFLVDMHHHYNPKLKNFTSILVADLDLAGVSKVCLFSSAPTHSEKEKKDWKKIFRSYSDRIIGFGTINPGKPKNEKEIVDEYFARGFKGLKFTLPSKRYDHDDFLDYYEKAEQYGMPVLFHTGVVVRNSITESEDISSEYMRPVYLDRIARLFPRLRMVAAHMGDPWFGEAYNTSQKNPLLWLDISGKGIWLKANALREHLGIRVRAEKIVFGLDEPSSQYVRVINAWNTILYEMGLDQKQRNMIFGGNAKKIIGSPL
jgi:predicted TIM-barrel fold metal-dependent hydrolase